MNAMTQGELSTIDNYGFLYRVLHARMFTCKQKRRSFISVYGRKLFTHVIAPPGIKHLWVISKYDMYWHVCPALGLKLPLIGLV